MGKNTKPDGTLQYITSDQDIHYLLSECFNLILEKMNNTTQRTMTLKMACPTNKGRKFKSSKMCQNKRETFAVILTMTLTSMCLDPHLN